MSNASSNSTGSGPSGDGILTAQGNTGGPVSPDGSGLINIVGTGSIVVTGDAGTNTLNISNTDVTWVSVSTSQVMAPNMGYFVVSPGGDVDLTLPTTSVQGDTVGVALDGGTSFHISQNAGQSIVFGNAVTTTGTSGYLASTSQGDSIYLVCRIPNTRWVQITAPTGNITTA